MNSFANERLLRKQNYLQIESARPGDTARFNGRDRPATIIDVTETDIGKELTLNGAKNGKYHLTFERNTALIEFRRTSGEGRHLRLRSFQLTNRAPRPFDRTPLDTTDTTREINPASIIDALSHYRDQFITDSGGLRDIDDAEVYRDITILTQRLRQTDGKYLLVGAEIELVQEAIKEVRGDETFAGAEERRLSAIVDLLTSGMGEAVAASPA